MEWTHVKLQGSREIGHSRTHRLSTLVLSLGVTDAGKLAERVIVTATDHTLAAKSLTTGLIDSQSYNQTVSAVEVIQNPPIPSSALHELYRKAELSSVADSVSLAEKVTPTATDHTLYSKTVISTATDTVRLKHGQGFGSEHQLYNKFVSTGVEDSVSLQEIEVPLANDHTLYSKAQLSTSSDAVGLDQQSAPLATDHTLYSKTVATSATDDVGLERIVILVPPVAE